MVSHIIIKDTAIRVPPDGQLFFRIIFPAITTEDGEFRAINYHQCGGMTFSFSRVSVI